MVSFCESAVTSDAALDLLAEYFSSRAESFPSTMGEYQATFPEPSDFVPPYGVFLLVEGQDLSGEDADVGCGGIRRIDDDAVGRFEVKHLWIQPHARGGGIGQLLLAELETRALALGAKEMVLDTNASQAAAARLYLRSGYAEIPAYNDNPNATHWYGKDLRTEPE